MMFAIYVFFIKNNFCFFLHIISYRSLILDKTTYQ